MTRAQGDTGTWGHGEWQRPSAAYSHSASPLDLIPVPGPPFQPSASGRDSTTYCPSGLGRDCVANFPLPHFAPFSTSVSGRGKASPCPPPQEGAVNHAPTLKSPPFSPCEKEWCSRWDSNPNRRLRRPEFYPLKYESVPPSKQAEHKGVKYFPKSSIWRAFLHPSSPHPSHPSRGQAPAPSARGRRRYAGPCGSGQAR